ncbi:MAG: hypothetical protein ABW107_12910, partial [Candidatus Thiodiazotropha sp. 6PLUC5]
MCNSKFNGSLKKHRYELLLNNIHNIDRAWSRKKSNKSVVCYERKLIKTYFMEYRANTLLNATYAKVVDVLKNISAYPEWMYNCTEAMELEAKDDFSKVIYYAQGSSLGHWNGDIILSARKMSDISDEKMVITINSIDNHAYKHPNLKVRAKRFRMTGFKGCWRLTAVSEKSTQVS